MSASLPPVPAPGASPCEVFTELSYLRGDREIEQAALARLDEHLARCPACRRRSREAEGVSRVLKAWDAAHASQVRAPARLALEVRSAIAEGARRRRAVVVATRLVHLATAASVLLVLGTAAALGLRGRSAGVAGPPAAVAPGAPAPLVFAALPPRPAIEPLRPPALERSLLAALGRPLPGTLRPLDPAIYAAARDVVLRIERAVLCQRAFEEELGQPGVWWTDPWTGKDRLVSQGALASLQDRGAGSVEGFVRGLAARVAVDFVPGHVYGHPDSASVATDRRARDLLGLPSDREGLDRWLAAPAKRLPGSAPGRGLDLRPTPERPTGPDPAGAARVLDLSRALAAGAVELRDGTGDDVVALIHAPRHAVFVPAGELLAGGRVDRAVAQPVWIPAGAQDRVMIPCVAVSTEREEAVEGVRAVGLVAGPALRALLARGAGREAALALVDAQVEPRGGAAYSLLAFYDHPGLRATVRENARAFTLLAWSGFVVTDAVGALRGAETTDLPREAAADLLARLLVGYGIETAMPSARWATADVGVPARVTLLDLLAHEGTFLAPASNTGGLRALALRDPRTGVRVDALEDVRTGRAVLVSALPDRP